MLENVFIKKRNEVFSRHQLATRRLRIPRIAITRSMHSKLTENKQKLSTESWNCRTISRRTVRDAFCNGIHSTQIRQRLLENQTSTLNQAVDQVNNLYFSETYELAPAMAATFCTRRNLSPGFLELEPKIYQNLPNKG